jgi:hypothetical protein
MAGILISYYSAATIVSDDRSLAATQTLTYSRTLQDYPFGQKTLKVEVVMAEGRADFYLLDSANRELYQGRRPFEGLISRPNMTGAFSTQLTPTNNTLHFIIDNSKGKTPVGIGITGIVDYGLGSVGAIISILGLGITYFGLSAKRKRRDKR